MGMKLFCIVSKIWVCWKLGHETPTETGLRRCDVVTEDWWYDCVSIMSNKGLDEHISQAYFFHLSNILDRSRTMWFCSIPLVHEPKFLKGILRFHNVKGLDDACLVNLENRSTSAWNPVPTAMLALAPAARTAGPTHATPPRFPTSRAPLRLLRRLPPCMVPQQLQQVAAASASHCNMHNTPIYFWNIQMKQL
jgi:hypothetical protein